MNEKTQKFIMAVWEPKPNQVVKYLEKPYIIKETYKTRVQLDNIWVEKKDVELIDTAYLFDLLFKIGFKIAINCTNTFDVTLIHPNSKLFTVSQNSTLHTAILDALSKFVEKYQGFCDLTLLYKKDEENAII